MAFGSIRVGTTFATALDIRNSGNSTLTLTGITGVSGYSTDWTGGTISPGGVQIVIVRFSPTAEQSYGGMLTVDGDQTSGTNTISISGTGTRAPDPLTTFDEGQYVVGTDIVPGRYYSDPTGGCYWERVSGFGGTPGEILANLYISFDARQWIVDVLSTDTAFKTDSECGTWFPERRHGLQGDITPGMWVVGSQVSPGTYRAAAGAGCYWERMSNFEGTLDGVIANYFADSAEQQVVEIRASDVGFQSDDDCGRWTRVASLAPLVRDARQSRAQIGSNRATERRANQLP